MSQSFTKKKERHTVCTVTDSSVNSESSGAVQRLPPVLPREYDDLSNHHMHMHMSHHHMHMKMSHDLSVLPREYDVT